MANPQKENGYTPIANEILDRLCKTQIRSEARQIFDFIIRKTYGFNKKMDGIAITDFQKATGLKRPQVCRSIKHLLARDIIIKGSDSIVTRGNGTVTTHVSTYGPQKDFEKWRGSNNGVTSNETVTGGSNKTPKKVVTKPSPSKEKIKEKKRIKTLCDDDFILELKKKFTWIDIDHELCKIDAWLLANPHRQKTRRFVVNWLNKIQKPLPKQQIKQHEIVPKEEAPEWIKQAVKEGWK